MSKRKRKKQGRRPLTEAQKRAAQMMFDAQPIGKIAEELGVCRTTVWRWRKRPAFQRELDRILNRFLKDKRAETMRRIREERIVPAYLKLYNIRMLQLNSSFLCVITPVPSS